MAAQEAKAHVAEAEKALKSSWMSLKFGPDHLTASMEYTQAATKYRAAGMLRESAETWVKAAQLKEKLHDLFGAGRAYESAGAIDEGGNAAVAENWTQAVRCFRLADKGEIAAKLLIKLAGLREKEKDMAAAKTAFQDAIEVFQVDEKDFHLGDVYKQYIGFLVRAGLFNDVPKAIDGHIAVLRRQGHDHFVYKEGLAKVVILLHMQDTVRADQALNELSMVDGWYTSKECQAGSDLVSAYQNNDAEGVQQVIKDGTFTYLQVEIARVAKSLRLQGLSAPRPAAPKAGAAAKAEPELAPEPEQQQPAGVNAMPEDVADMLC